MKQTALLSSVIKTQRQREQARRDLQAAAGRALSASKRAIFQLQRGDMAGAKTGIASALAEINTTKKSVAKDPQLLAEGTWRAALEECCEAIYLERFLSHGNLDGAVFPTEDPEILIGGMSDFVGELARLAVLRATEGDGESVEHFHDIAQTVIETLLQLDLTGSLRSKFDQAKQHVRKLEDIRYDLSGRS
jgi:predicted translin family RNA/ssDNA-binding protein